MKIATWNVNSLRVRLTEVCAWVGRHAPDVLALQETKVEDAQFPESAFTEMGYQVLYAGQKTYNGVALLSRHACTDNRRVLGPDDPQQRYLAATICGVRIVNVYVPNGSQVDSDKYLYKLAWLRMLESSLREDLQRYPELLVLGDFNIAPEDRDVHDPLAWEGSVLVSKPERQQFQALLNLGLIDLFRAFPQAEALFSWWDYRVGAFRRNRGLRIDHVLGSAAMHLRCVRCDIDREPRASERPSDHAPVIAEFVTDWPNLIQKSPISPATAGPDP